MTSLKLLSILFIGLKLANIITWSWLIVLSPLFIIFLIYAVIIVLACIVIASE